MAIKWFKSPFICVIFLLTQPQVANQPTKKKRTVQYLEKDDFSQKIGLLFSLRQQLDS